MLHRGLFFLGLLVAAVRSDMSLEKRNITLSAGCGYKCETDADCAGLACPQCVLVDSSLNYSLCSLKVTPTSTFQSVSISNEPGKISALTIVMDSPSNSMGSLEVLFDCSASPGCGCKNPWYGQQWYEERNSNCEYYNDCVTAKPSGVPGVPGSLVYLSSIPNPINTSQPTRFEIRFFLFEIQGSVCAFTVQTRGSIKPVSPLKLSLPQSVSTDVSEMDFFEIIIPNPPIDYAFTLNTVAKASSSYQIFMSGIGWCPGHPNGACSYDYQTLDNVNNTFNGVQSGQCACYRAQGPGSSWVYQGYVYSGAATVTATAALPPVATQTFSGTLDPSKNNDLFGFLIEASPKYSCVHVKVTEGTCNVRADMDAPGSGYLCYWDSDDCYEPLSPTSTKDCHCSLYAATLPNGTSISSLYLSFGNTADSKFPTTGCSGVLTYDNTC